MMRHMTNKQFQTLCEQVLIPRFGDFTFQQLSDLYRAVDEISSEFFWIGNRVGWIAARLNAFDQHEDH